MLAAERKVTSKLLEQDTSAEKLYILNEYAGTFEGKKQVQVEMTDRSAAT